MKTDERNGYVAENNKWRVCRALEYVRNFLKNHKGEINDSDFFGAFDSVIEKSALGKKLLARFAADGVLCDGRGEELPDTRVPDDATVIDNDGDTESVRRRLRRADSSRELLEHYWGTNTTRRSTAAVLDEIIDSSLAGETVGDAAADPLCGRLDEAQHLFGLTAFERDLLTVCALRGQNLIETDVTSRRGRTANNRAEGLAKFLDCSTARVLAAVQERQRLYLYGCLDDDFDVPSPFENFLDGLTEKPLTDRYYSAVTEEALPWDFFSEIVKRHGKTLTGIVRAAAGKSPCNILLYGAPGTGKTSFARALAAELGLKAYAVSSGARAAGERGGHNNTELARGAAVRVCARQLPHAESLLIVDEADSMFWQNRGMLYASKMEKGEMNELLELRSAPTVWISNNARGELDDSNCRRFDYSIHFDALTNRQRAAIWRNALKKAGLAGMFTAREIQTFAAKYPVSAGGIAIAVKNLAEQRPEGRAARALVGAILKPHCELMGIGVRTRGEAKDTLKPAKDYSLDGLNISGKVKLEEVVEAVRGFCKGARRRAPDAPRMNILLSGMPGTGKTEFVKYLGAVLKKKVRVVMGSELLDCWVGGTEKNVRSAFARAAKNREILFLDEIDGLVQSRKGADHSWEVSQVNEILHQMENFGGVMVGATNFADNLDDAIMRRFTFKLKFDFLDNDGKAKFFTRFFKTELTAEDRRLLDAVPNLAPGDFRTVRQSRYYLGGKMRAADWIAALREEVSYKKLPSGSGKTIGF